MKRPVDDSQQVQRLTADVQMLQAHVTSMRSAVLAFGDELQRLTNLTCGLAEHVNTLAGELAERRNGA